MRKLPAHLVSTCDSLHEHEVHLITDGENAYVYAEVDVTDVWADDEQPTDGTLVVLATCSQPLNADDSCEARVTWTVTPDLWGNTDSVAAAYLRVTGAPLRNLTLETKGGETVLNLTALASALVTVARTRQPGDGDPFWGGAAMMWRTLTGAKTDEVALQEARAILATAGNVTARVNL